MNSELDYFEKVHNKKMDNEFLGPDSLEEMKLSALFKVKSAAIALPKFHPDFNLVAKNVLHFYLGLHVYNGEHPSTPVFNRWV